MADIPNKKVEASKAGSLPSAQPKGLEVNWGNAEKVKILLLDKIANELAEVIKLLKEKQNG